MLMEPTIIGFFWEGLRCFDYQRYGDIAGGFNLPDDWGLTNPVSLIGYISDQPGFLGVYPLVN